MRAAGEGGKTVLFIHGFGGDLDNWLFNLDAIAEKHKRLRARSAGARPIDAEAARHDARAISRSSCCAFMDALDIGEAHLVGHSMGGGVAAQMAVDAPARVLSVALIRRPGSARRSTTATPRASSKRSRGAI